MSDVQATEKRGPGRPRKDDVRVTDAPLAPPVPRNVLGEAKPDKTIGRSRRQMLEERVTEIGDLTLCWCDPKRIYDGRRHEERDYPGHKFAIMGLKRREDWDHYNPGFECWTVPTATFKAWEKENTDASKRQLYGKSVHKYNPAGGILEAEAEPISEREAARHEGGDYFEGQPVTPYDG